jgi:hypothetical protein
VSDPKNEIEVDKATVLKEWKQKAVVTVLFWAGFGLFVLGVFLFGNSFVDQGYSLKPPEFSQLHEAKGIFTEIRSGRVNLFVVMDNKTGHRYSCNAGCGFEDYMDVIGKPVKVLTYEDSIYQIEVDNVVKVDYAKRVKYTSKYIREGIIIIIQGIIVMALVQVYKRRLKRGSNG